MSSTLLTPIWRYIYSVLLNCRKNIFILQPEEYVAFPINGEPDITNNHCRIQQAWPQGSMLYQILDKKGIIRGCNHIIVPVKTLQLEYNAMMIAISKKVDFLKTFFKDNFTKLLLGIKPWLGIYNVYGHIVFKKGQHTLL